MRADADALIDRGADAIAVARAAIANPDWVEQMRDRREPRRPPLTRRELVERGLSPGFVEYMTRWKGFVAS